MVPAEASLVYSANMRPNRNPIKTRQDIKVGKFNHYKVHRNNNLESPNREQNTPKRVGIPRN